jgi:hypothetical protein
MLVWLHPISHWYICTGHINNHSRLYPLLAISVLKMNRQALFESEPYGQMTKTSYLRMASLVGHGWVLTNDFLMSDAISRRSHSHKSAVYHHRRPPSPLHMALWPTYITRHNMIGQVLVDFWTIWRIDQYFESNNTIRGQNWSGLRHLDLRFSTPLETVEFQCACWDNTSTSEIYRR